MAGAAGVTATARPRWPPRRPDARTLLRPAVTAVLLLFVLLALPQMLSLYYIDAMTQVVVYSVVALGLGVLVGRVGLVSLGQVAVLAIGAWVAARLLFATSQPYPVVLLEAGVITMAAGTLIGLPALRLRGLYLALITLMLAGGITIVLATTNFPNGGAGPAGLGRRSGRASRRRWPRGSTSRSTSCGRSRWHRSSRASPAECWRAPSTTCSRSASPPRIRLRCWPSC